MTRVATLLDSGRVLPSAVFVLKNKVFDMVIVTDYNS